MKRFPGGSRDRVLEFEHCESRNLLTLVFILSGNGFSATGPKPLTAFTSKLLEAQGNQAIQLSTPTISTPGAFYGVAKQIQSLSHGQPIGLVGFSSGGALAVRLSGIPALNVTAALDDYGPPDVQDYFNYHGNDTYSQYVMSHAHLTDAVISLMSGPIHTTTYVDAAFGLTDHNVVASVSAASFQKDVPNGKVFNYPGGHGVSVINCPAALDDFLAHLVPFSTPVTLGR